MLLYQTDDCLSILFLKKSKVFCILKISEFFGDFFGSFIDNALKILLGGLQVLAYLDVLRAMPLAFTAADALRGGSGVFSQRGAHKIFRESPEFSLRVAAVICGERARNINALGAGHAVAAARAGNLHFLVYRGNHA